MLSSAPNENAWKGNAKTCWDSFDCWKIISFFGSPSLQNIFLFKFSWDPKNSVIRLFQHFLACKESKSTCLTFLRLISFRNVCIRWSCKELFFFWKTICFLFVCEKRGKHYKEDSCKYIKLVQTYQKHAVLGRPMYMHSCVWKTNIH